LTLYYSTPLSNFRVLLPIHSPLRIPLVIAMAKRKNSAVVSPKCKRAKHIPLPPADDENSMSPSHATSPHGTVTDAAEEDDDPQATEDVGKS
jgi:hypothetical protein